MHWLQTSYSVWFNRRHGRVGPLFQGRYQARVVEAEAWGLAASWYVHLNPARVGRLGLGKADRQAARLGAREPASAELVQERLQVLRARTMLNVET